MSFFSKAALTLFTTSFIFSVDVDTDEIDLSDSENFSTKTEKKQKEIKRKERLNVFDKKVEAENNFYQLSNRQKDALKKSFQKEIQSKKPPWRSVKNLYKKSFTLVHRPNSTKLHSTSLRPLLKLKVPTYAIIHINSFSSRPGTIQKNRRLAYRRALLVKRILKKRNPKCKYKIRALAYLSSKRNMNRKTLVKVSSK